MELAPTYGPLSPEASPDRLFKLGGGDEALQRLIKEKKLTIKGYESLKPHQREALRQRIIQRGMRRFEQDNANAKRFNKKVSEVGAEEFANRQNSALQYLLNHGLSKEEAEGVIRFKPNPNQFAQKHVNKYGLKPVSSVPDPAEPAAPVVPVGENNADSEPLADAPAPTQDEPVESAPVQAAAITQPQTNRQLMVAEAKRKYKDSPFKQWAHANQKLAMAVRPGQAGYAQVQEYLQESGLLKKDLKIKQGTESNLNIGQQQFTGPITPAQQRFIKPTRRSEQVDTPGMGMAMADPLRGY
jgi:hypothetical protein